MGRLSYSSCGAESSVSVLSPTSKTPSSKNQQERILKIQKFNYNDLAAATNGFSDQKLLGKGSHGCVYKGVIHGRDVAIKKPSRGVKVGGQEADNEIEILSKIRSPRLVNLLGFSNDNAKGRLIVIEFMSNGTLYDVLHSNPRVPLWGRRVRLALQIAKAVETLHSQNPPIIHRDIKSANVLLDKNFNARLSDFGLALSFRDHDVSEEDDTRGASRAAKSMPPAGTIGYLDPHYYTPTNLSAKTDVFSYGILLLELISGRKAMDMANSPACIVDWAIPLIKKGKFGAVFDPRIVPIKDPLIRKQLALIGAKCVRSCKERRPSMKEVVDWLTDLSKSTPLHLWNWLNNPCLAVEEAMEDQRRCRTIRLDAG